MKLPKLFGKKKDDEDDFDDDFDEEEFDMDDLDDHIGEMETMVVEEDEDLTGNYGSGPVSENDRNDDHDEVMIGSDDTIENPFDGVDDEYDDDLDDDQDYEDDDESSRKGVDDEYDDDLDDDQEYEDDDGPRARVLTTNTTMIWTMIRNTRMMTSPRARKL